MQVNNPNKLPTAPISEFKPSQGDLKYLSKQNYNKLKTVIEKNGFDIPVYIWIAENGEKFLLDGHQRQKVLTKEGWNEPVPYLIIKADDMQSAAQRLLEITSQYGTITQEGIDQFIATHELSETEMLETASFDGVLFYELGEEVKNKEDKPDATELRDSMSVILSFDKMAFVEFMGYANYYRELYGVETVTDAVVQAVKEKYENTIR